MPAKKIPTRPLCYNCATKPARPGKLFCAEACAGRWAEAMAAGNDLTWCPTKEEWVTLEEHEVTNNDLCPACGATGGVAVTHEHTTGHASRPAKGWVRMGARCYATVETDDAGNALGRVIKRANKWHAVLGDKALGHSTSVRKAKTAVRRSMEAAAQAA